MKTFLSKIKIAGVVLMIAIQTPGYSQNKNKITALMNIESIGLNTSSEALGSMAQLEFEKTGYFTMMDRYDVNEKLKANNISSCYGKTCAVQAGKLLNADNVIIGSAEKFEKKIAVTLKIVNVSSGEVEKSNTTEFVPQPDEIQNMIEISVKQLLGLKVPSNKLDMLIAYDQPIESPRTQSNLSGPRIGAFTTTGKAGELLRADEKNGGFGMYAISSMIGWQQEVQYLSSGNFSALIEFLYTISGLEAGRFIPGFTMMNGFRMGRQGWEFAVGPNIRFMRYPTSFSSPTLTSALAIGAGRTFHSGYLNIPVNVYMIPRKTGNIFGISAGFNIQKNDKVNKY